MPQLPLLRGKLHQNLTLQSVESVEDSVEEVDVEAEEVVHLKQEQVVEEVVVFAHHFDCLRRHR